MRNRTSILFCRVALATLALTMAATFLPFVERASAAPAAPEVATGEWCGAPGQQSSYVPLPGQQMFDWRWLSSGTWATKKITGDATTGGPGLGIPEDASAVVLQTFVTPASDAAGVLLVSPEQSSSGAASLIFDSEDNTSTFSVTVEPNAQGEISWLTYGPSWTGVAFWVSGYYESGGDGFVPSPHRLVADTGLGLGMSAAGKASELVVDSTALESGVPAGGVASVVATVRVSDVPDGTAVYAGASASDQVWLGYANEPASSIGSGDGSLMVSGPLTVDEDSNFVVSVVDENGAPVDAEISAWIDGWFGEGIFCVSSHR